MACVLPFNSISVGGVEIAGPAAFEYGSGSLELAGDDTAITTADGRIHNYRNALTPSASCALRGDKRSNETGYASGSNGSWPAAPQAIVLKYYTSRDDSSPATVWSGNGVVGIEYDTQSNRSNVTVTASETAY